MNLAEWYQQYFWLVWYLAAVNLATFIIYGYDKMKAGASGASRISERALLILALIGGSVGALAGMNIFRHKTKKLEFQAPLAAILALQIFAIWLLLDQL